MVEQNLGILIVDDDPHDLDGLKQTLSSLHIQLSTLQDPFQVLDQVKSQRPDLILLDALLPGLSGFDLCKQIKTSPETKNSVVLILTGVYLKEHYRREALNQFKADGFLTKPYRTKDLQRLVVKLLAKKLKITPKKLEETIGLSTDARLHAEREKKPGWLDRLLGRWRAGPAPSGFLHTVPASPRLRKTAKEPVRASGPMHEAAVVEAEKTAEGEKEAATVSRPEAERDLGPGPAEEARDTERAEAEAGEEEHPSSSAEVMTVSMPEPTSATPEEELEPVVEDSEAEPAAEGAEPKPDEATSADGDVPEGDKAEPPLASEPAAEDLPVAEAAPAEGLSTTEPAAEDEELKSPEGPSLDDELPEGEKKEGFQEPSPAVESLETDEPKSDAYILQPPEEPELDIQAAKNIFKTIADALDDTQESIEELTREEFEAKVEIVADEHVDVAVGDGEAAVELSDDQETTVTVRTRAVDEAELPREPSAPSEVAVAPSRGRRPFVDLPIYEEEDFLYELKRHLMMCKRVGRSFTLIMVRIADLGQISELFGKDARAKVFLHVARQGVSAVREIDMIGLLRSEELIALTAFASERYGGDRIISRLKATLKRNPFSVGENIPPFVPKLHFGMATYPSEVEGLEELFERARSGLAL